MSPRKASLGLALLITVLALPAWAAAPVIIGVDQPVIQTAGIPVNYQIQATGNPIFFSATPLPPGLSINTQTGLISGSTQFTGNTNITLTASNQPPGQQNETNTGSAIVVFTFKATQPNISNALEIRTSLGRKVNFPLSATGIPAPTFKITSLPPGLKLDGNIITGVPLQGGVINATLTATNAGPLNSGGTDTKPFLINVTSPSEITSPLVIPGVVNTPIDYRIEATKNPHTFGLTGAPIAGGIAIDVAGTQTGFLSGSPTQAGQFPAFITATNDINYDNTDPCTFTNTTATGRGQVIFAISTVAGAPAITSTNSISCVEALPFSFSITATNGPTTFAIETVGANQLPGFTMTTLPPGLTLDAGTGIISGVPTIAAAPTFDVDQVYTYTINATNGNGTGRYGLTLTVQPARPTFLLDKRTYVARTEVPFQLDIPTTFYPPESGVALQPSPAVAFELRDQDSAFNSGIPTNVALGGTENITIHPRTGRISGTPSNAGGDNFGPTETTGRDYRLVIVSVRATNNQGVFQGSFNLVISNSFPGDGEAIILPTADVAQENCPYRLEIPVPSATNWTMSVAGPVPLDLNLVINPDDGTITGTPATGTSAGGGVYTLTVDADGPVNPFDITLTVTNTPQVPVPVALVANQNYSYHTVGERMVFPVNVTSTANNAPMIFSGSPLPRGDVLQSGRGISNILVDGDPTVNVTGVPNESGTIQSRLAVVNAIASDTKLVTFTIAPVQIFSQLTATGIVGSPFLTLDLALPAGNDTAYFIRATGGANQFDATGLPPGLKINKQTGEISGIPANTGSATPVNFNVTIFASNGDSSDTETLVITINPRSNTAPDISNTTLAVSILDGQSYTVASPVFDVDATITAPAVGPVVFSATGLPQGLTMDPNNGVITGTTSQLGLFPVLVRATATGSPAGDRSDAEILNLTVLAVPPVIDTTTQFFGTTVTVNTAFTYVINVTGSRPIALSAPAASLPNGVVISNLGITGTPTQTGVFTIPITAAGPGGTDIENFILTVVQAPVINGTDVNDVITLNAVVGDAFSYTPSAVGFEAPIFSFSPSDIAALADVGLTFNGTSITGTPDEERPAGLTVTLIATNNTGVDTATLLIRILGVQINSPLIAGGAVGQAFSYTITATGNPTTFTATNLPAGLTFSGATISGVPIAPGQTLVPITAANALSGASATLIIAISTTPGAPAITSSLSANGVLNNAFTYAITATNSPTSFAATGLPAGLNISTSSGLITGAPTVTGSFPVTITATNAIGSGSASLTIAVASVSGGTAITSPLTATAVQGQPFTYQITSIGTPIITFGAGGLPAGLTCNPVTGVISGTPTVANTFPVILQATNFTTATATLQLTVVSQAAVINSPTTVTSPVGQAFSYIITATGVAPITFSVTGTLPSGLSFDPATAAITGVPTVEGVTTVTLTATNAFGTDNETLTITIGPRAPLISSPLTASGQTNVPFSYQITASGSVPITFGASSLPPGLVVDSNGLITGTPTQIGTFNVILTATNSIGSDVKTLVVTITEALDDFDQDGFPNELEIAFGSDPQNPNSTPFGGAPVASRGILSLQGVKIKLTFSSVGRDSVTQKGSFALPAGYTLANKNATVIVGGFLANLGALTDKGAAAVGTNKLSIKASKNGAPAKYSLTLKGDLKGSFTDEGLSNENIDKKLNATRTVRTFLLLDATGTTPLLYENSKQLLYTAKQGKTGSASGK